MNAPLDMLFWPRPRDESGVLWGPRYTSINLSLASTGVEIGSTVAAAPWPLIGPEFIEWVQNVRVRAVPGAGQNVDRIDLGLVDSAGNPLIGLAHRSEPGAADQQMSLDIRPRIPLIGDRHMLRAAVFFNAGVAANEVYLEAASVVTIRGNVAMF